MTMLVEGVLPDGDGTPAAEPGEGNTMAKYLFAVWDGGGSAPPELAVAQQLVERGHDVVVLADPVLEDDVRATGGRFRPWEQATARTSRRPEDDPIKDWECKTPISLFRRVADKSALRAGARLRGRHRGGHRGRAARRDRVLLHAPRGADRGRGRRHPPRPDDAELLLGPGAGHAAVRVRLPAGARGRWDGSATALMNGVSTKALGTGLPKLNELRTSRGLRRARLGVGPGEATPTRCSS